MNPQASLTIISTISLALAMITLASLLQGASAQTAEQQQQQAAPSSQNSGELLRQLMQLTAAQQQRQLDDTTTSAQEQQLGRLLLDGASKKATKQQQKKLALKRKWHKLVDELIDGEQSAVDTPVARKRPLEPLEERNQQVSSYLQPAASPEDDSKFVILVKRKPEGGAELPQPRQPLNAEQHHRRILDDDFGVLRAAKFTTNNHLGAKEMPKFGSDEQF